VKTLCDIHAVPFKSYLSRQFSIAFDLYLSILNNVDRFDRLVQVSLERDSANYCIKHLCPSCTYILEGEEKLKFSMLYTVDGNDSLKRILQREEAPEQHEVWEPATVEPAQPVLGPSSEVKDSRTAGRGVYLIREQVDEWAKEVLMEDMPGFDFDNNNPCAERWRNMKTELTSKMWGVFEETGLFLALCRHGFVLLLVDMVQSGEL
jgi:Kyakuja-Dileera-Zisupton transposase